MTLPPVAIAWDLIGSEGSFRIVGGRTVYESVDYHDSTPGVNVKLSRLVADDPGGLRVVVRYVDPDTLLEVLS